MNNSFLKENPMIPLGGLFRRRSKVRGEGEQHLCVLICDPFAFKRATIVLFFT